ncbi:MAG: hypothetical protein HY080_04420 [Gammaproteobacteria bacterium]|nr:hypothetical protein [Gammaproteobacteria bacterium]
MGWRTARVASFLPAAGRPSFITLLALCAGGLFCSTLYHRLITADDAWFAEQAYWVAKLGYLRSELFAGLLGYETHQWVYHKLHIWQGAAVVRLVGWSAYYFKAIALGYLVLFIGLSRYYVQRYHRATGTGIWGIFLALFLVNKLVVQFSFDYRPEIMMMCVGFAEYLLLRHGIDQHKTSAIIVAALLAGINVLFHLNGTVFVIAGAVLLVANRRYALVGVFLGVAMLVSALYFLDVARHGAFEDWAYQFRHDPAVPNRQFTGWGVLYRLVFEYHRFTLHVYEASYTVLFVMIGVLSWRILRTDSQAKSLLIYAGAIELTLILITPATNPGLLLFYMPYIILTGSLYLQALWRQPRLRRWLLAPLLVYGLSHAGFNLWLCAQSNTGAIALHQQIVREFHLQPQDRILAPMIFVFNEIGSAHIQGELDYAILSRDNPALLEPKVFFPTVGRDNRAFLILSPAFVRDLGLTQLHPGQHYYGYRYAGQRQGLAIFVRLMGDLQT